MITFLIDILFFKNLYGEGGLIYTQFFVFVTNGLISPLLWLADPWAIKRFLKQKRILSKVEDTGNKISMTQKEAHEFSFSFSF